MTFSSCPSCTALLQLGLSLTRQGERLKPGDPGAEHLRRLHSWQQSARDHLATHSPKDTA